MNMNDLINRRDAIEALFKECMVKGTIDEFDTEDILRKLPSAEPERWIPVTERLPKPWQEVLTTYEYNGKRYVQTAEYAGQDDENGNPLFCAFSDEFAPDHYNFVYVAWQPLPEPWGNKKLTRRAKDDVR